MTLVNKFTEEKKFIENVSVFLIPEQIYSTALST